MSDKNNYEWAIETVQIASKLYKVRFEFYYGSVGKSGYVRDAGNQWRIKVMGKNFYHKDFAVCCQQAVTFVYNAHENNK